MTHAQLAREIYRSGMFTMAQARIAAEVVLDRLRVFVLTTQKRRP
jgi:hypothetical protein